VLAHADRIASPVQAAAHTQVRCWHEADASFGAPFQTSLVRKQTSLPTSAQDRGLSDGRIRAWEAAGARGWIRTSTVHHLKVTPPADWATRAVGGSGGIEPPPPCGLGALPTRCIAALPTVLADGARFERAHPFGFAGLACRCLTSRPTIQKWRKRRESNPQGLAARTVFGTGPLANGVCASMFATACVGAPSWIRTSNTCVLSAVPLPGWTTGASLQLGWTDARQARAGDRSAQIARART
jgi:hypothetical protein